MTELPNAAPLDEGAWDRLSEHAQSFGVHLAPNQLDQLRGYFSLLIDWNRRFNLTAVRSPQEILVKHFLDSLSCACVINPETHRRMVDVGTGAGFPGMVLKIAFPHLEVTLLDAVEKRLAFLDRVAQELGLANVRTVHARAEDASGTWKGPARSVSQGREVPNGSLRERFDLVTARAVARLNVLSEWLLPFARVGGEVVAMKGPDVREEVDEAERAIKLLGGQVGQVKELVLPDTDIGRSLVLLRKDRPTPKAYPRRPGTARKAPL